MLVSTVTERAGARLGARLQRARQHLARVSGCPGPGQGARVAIRHLQCSARRAQRDAHVTRAGPGALAAPCACCRFAATVAPLVRRVYLSPPLGAVSQSPANKDAAGSAPGALAPPLAQRLLADPPNWAEYLGYLFTCGAVGGTLLDGVHSRVGLQVYDVLPLTLLGGTLRTSLLVPPLLGAFYAVLGTLFALSDNYAQSGTPGGDPATADVRKRSSAPEYVILGAVTLFLNLDLSAWMHSHSVPPAAIFAVLSLCALASWKVFDGTKQGAILAAVCALGAPASELLLLHAFGLWHYPRADILGGAFVSWVPLCYAFYTPALGNLSRFLWRTCRAVPLPPPSDD